MALRKQPAFRINTEHLVRCISADLGPSKGDMLTSDMSLEDADRLSLRRSILKKFKDLTHPEASERAIASFIADNERCRTFRIQPKSWFDDYVLGEVTTLLDRWLHDSDGCPATLMTLTDMSKCGPGSSVDVDLPAFYTKLFDSTLSTANPTLRRLYTAAISKNPTWFAAEEAREAHHGNRTVQGSKLSTVRKQFDTDRTIATEPPLEMFFQLGIGGFIETDVLAKIGINLSTQPLKNRWMARRGSLDGDIATLDLKSASNSISMALLTLFPKWFTTWLTRCRSAQTRLPGGSYLDLYMVASMGNGYCFPLQTMLFASVIVACYRLHDIEPNFGSAENADNDRVIKDPHINCGVFGDDICVRREVYHSVIRALELLGFIVNQDKSFNTGQFRESCGEDYFRGFDIRGVYIKTLATRGDCYSTINRLLRWSTKTGIPVDFTVSYLLSAIGFLPIPYTESDDGGVKVPVSYQPQWYSIASQGAALYYVQAYKAERLRVAEMPDDEPGTLRDYVMGFNPCGIVVSYLGGYIRDGWITVRGDRDDGTSSSRSEVLLRSIPYWGYIPKAEEVVSLRGNSWEAVVERVLALCFTRWRPSASPE